MWQMLWAYIEVVRLHWALPVTVRFLLLSLKGRMMSIGLKTLLRMTLEFRAVFTMRAVGQKVFPVRLLVGIVLFVAMAVLEVCV